MSQVAQCREVEKNRGLSPVTYAVSLPCPSRSAASIASMTRDFSAVAGFTVSWTTSMSVLERECSFVYPCRSSSASTSFSVKFFGTGIGNVIVSFSCGRAAKMDCGVSRRTGRPQRELTPGALAVLAAYPWPGNIRELRNVLEQVTLGSDNARLSAEEFTLALPRVRAGERPSLRLADVVADAERSAIRSALAAAEGKKILAAELLGISRATLYQKLAVLAPERSG